ncbi:hypothetical protein FE844_002990 [Rhizobium indicum]|uniref:hypothetical protein n=1 Tax=Rhizobium indicum TaxID=2583231 RepID=UPI0011058F6B|nr:hypothetical protein [Rhizobium indicum]QKK28603.1 hypothetical protein FE844_002990 [Rhizobium indicum]
MPGFGANGRTCRLRGCAFCFRKHKQNQHITGLASVLCVRIYQLLPRDTSETHMERKIMSQKTPLSSAALIHQKTEAGQRLLELRQAQADALGRGEDFQKSDEISKISERMAALDTAIAGAEEREAGEAAKAALVRTRARAAEIKQMLQENEDHRTAALSKAEMHLRGFVDAIGGAYLSLTEKQRLYILESIDFYNHQPEHLQRLGDIYSHKPGGMHLDHAGELGNHAVFIRLGNYLGAALAAISPRQIGNVSWDLHNMTDARSWVEQERNAVRGKIEGETVRNMEFIENQLSDEAEDAD